MTHDVDLSFAKTGTEFSNLKNGYLILDGVNERSDPNVYGGYIPLENLEGIISLTMFHKPISVVRYKHHPKTPVISKCITPEQERDIQKIIDRMERKGIIRFSRARTMVKPMMTADEWLEQMKSGELH